MGGKFGENCETTCGKGRVDTWVMQKLIDNRRDYKAVNAAFVAAGINCRNRNGVIATGGQPWEPSFEGESGVEKCWNRPDGVTKCQTPKEPNCFGPGTNWKYNYGPDIGRTFPYNTRALCPCKATAPAPAPAPAQATYLGGGNGGCGNFGKLKHWTSDKKGTQDECEGACNESSKCVSYSWRTNGGACYLYEKDCKLDGNGSYMSKYGKNGKSTPA